MTLTCPCGDTRLTLSKRPDFIHECNCGLCRPSGARWGYFHPDEVRIEGATIGYCRPDKDDPAAERHFCAHCGATTHFRLTDSAVAKFGNSVMGVNMFLAPEHDLSGIDLRFPDGANWPGQGEFSYIRESRILGQS